MVEPRVDTVNSRPSALLWVVILLALFWGVWKAVAVAWNSDDAFITFRYARSLWLGFDHYWDPIQDESAERDSRS